MKPLADVPAVAARLSVKPSWIYAQCEAKNPTLPHVRIGKYLRFDLDEIDKYIEAQRAGGGR